MFHTFLVTAFIMFAILAGFLGVISEFPKPELIIPSECLNCTVFCGDIEMIGLKYMFNLLFKQLDNGKKHFKRFYLNNNLRLAESEKNTLKSSF
jgi:hypothetical protein